MCGIYGIVSFGPPQNLAILEQIFFNLEQANARRGPDALGRKFIQNDQVQVLFGHSRLKICGQDESGDQPSTLAKDKILTYNGEIYNAQKLALENSIEFDSLVTSDTKIAALLFDQWKEFDGMFAMAQFDTKTNELALVRDPLGIKPLYWAVIDKTIVFSSFLQAIANCGLIKPEPNNQELEVLENLGASTGAQTLYKNIQTLLPGQEMRATKNSITFKNTPLKSLAEARHVKTPFCLSALEDLFLSNLEQTIPKQTPFTVALSSGLDSSLIAAGCTKLGYRPKTITLEFSKTHSSVQEGSRAKAIAQKLGLKNFCVKITEEQIAQELNLIGQAMDYQSRDGINTYFLSKEASKQAKVILSGLGADELFLGYRTTMQAYQILTDPAWKRRLKLKVEGFLPNFLKFRLGLDFYRRFSTQTQPAGLVAMSRAPKNFVSWPEVSAFNKQIYNLSLQNQLTLSELHFYTQPILLRDSDWASMNFGLELRVPFLNQSFVKTILSWQSDQPKPCLNKKWLWLLARKWCIDGLINKQKLGFVGPGGFY